MAVKLTVSISVIPDPSGRTMLDGSKYDVFKAVAVYFVGDNSTPAVLTGWTGDYDKTSQIKKYTAYADNLEDLEALIDELDVSMFVFPPAPDTPSDDTNL